MLVHPAMNPAHAHTHTHTSAHTMCQQYKKCCCKGKLMPSGPHLGQPAPGLPVIVARKDTGSQGSYLPTKARLCAPLIPGIALLGAEPLCSCNPTATPSKLAALNHAVIHTIVKCMHTSAHRATHTHTQNYRRTHTHIHVHTLSLTHTPSGGGVVYPEGVE